MGDLRDPEAQKDPRHFELMTSALQLGAQGHHDFAVIGLQTAVYLELT